MGGREEEYSDAMVFFFSSYNKAFKKFLLIDFSEIGREKEREGNITLLSHLFIYSLVDSCMWPDWDQTHNLGYQDNKAVTTELLPGQL